MNFDDKIKQALGKGKKKQTTSFSNLSMSGVLGKNPVSDFVGKVTTKPLTKAQGASPRMQNIWNRMGPVQKSTARRYMTDTDGDRVPDRFDCQPRNPMRQDSDIPFEKRVFYVEFSDGEYDDTGQYFLNNIKELKKKDEFGDLPAELEVVKKLMALKVGQSFKYNKFRYPRDEEYFKRVK